jgi:hypothetical protein
MTFLLMSRAAGHVREQLEVLTISFSDPRMSDLDSINMHLSISSVRDAHSNISLAFSFFNRTSVIMMCCILFLACPRSKQVIAIVPELLDHSFCKAQNVLYPQILHPQVISISFKRILSCYWRPESSGNITGNRREV